MTTGDENITQNERFIQGEKLMLRQLIVRTSREALRRFTRHEDHDEAIEGAANFVMTSIDAGGGVQMLAIMRDRCAHTWISTDRHVCADCGEIGPAS